MNEVQRVHARGEGEGVGWRSAHAVGPRGRVVALEPHPALSGLLAANVRANRLVQVDHLRLAAGACNGVARFTGFASDGGNWGISREVANDASDGVEFSCDVRPHDDLLDGLGIDGVDLLKIDVEGGEADVVLAVGTRLQDFTTGSWDLFRNPERRIVGLNVQPFDAHKHRALALVADARAGLG